MHVITIMEVTSLHKNIPVTLLLAYYITKYPYYSFSFRKRSLGYRTFAFELFNNHIPLGD